MAKRYHSFRIILLTFFLICFDFTKLHPAEAPDKISIKPGFSLEYFLTTINWDENKYTSKLKSYFASLNTEFELTRGFSLNILFGFAFSHYKDLIFRKLPLSLRLEDEGLKGYILGGEIKKSIISTNNIEIDGLGKFVSYFGIKKNWDIPGLSVKGIAQGKPVWMRFSMGPVFVYKGLNYFSPYLFVNFNKLWGKFKIDQSIQELKRTEDKKISGESLFGITAGSTYEVTDKFAVTGEISLMPYKNGADFGFFAKVMYSF